eukprot:1153066-Pelagomonas_calceolata.AAC.5
MTVPNSLFLTCTACLRALSTRVTWPWKAASLSSSDSSAPSASCTSFPTAPLTLPSASPVSPPFPGTPLHFPILEASSSTTGGACGRKPLHASAQEASAVRGYCDSRNRRGSCKGGLTEVMSGSIALQIFCPAGGAVVLVLAPFPWLYQRCNAYARRSSEVQYQLCRRD